MKLPAYRVQYFLNFPFLNSGKFSTSSGAWIISWFGITEICRSFRLSYSLSHSKQTGVHPFLSSFFKIGQISTWTHTPTRSLRDITACAMQDRIMLVILDTSLALRWFYTFKNISPDLYLSLRFAFALCGTELLSAFAIINNWQSWHV